MFFFSSCAPRVRAALITLSVWQGFLCPPCTGQAALRAGAASIFSREGGSGSESKNTLFISSRNSWRKNWKMAGK
jgi:hypothetical protein